MVYSVGYNIDMLEVAPTAALTSSQNNWSVLYRDTLEKFIAGEEVPVDYAVGISEDAVMISKLGPECAEGTQEAIDAAIEQLKAGELHVFAGPLKGVSPDGQTIEIPEGDYYHEQEEQSAPSWQYIVEGCTAVE